MRARDEHPAARKTLAHRLHLLVNAATPPSPPEGRERAKEEAARLAARLGAMLIREKIRDDVLASAVAEYLEARSGGFKGWVQ